MLLAICMASAPDKRITPMAPVPAGVANATMVSVKLMFKNTFFLYYIRAYDFEK
jgi:hypothetical protein